LHFFNIHSQRTHIMSTTGRNSHTSRNSSNGWWSFRHRQPKEPEAADLVFPEIAPYYPNRLRNRVILGIVLVLVVVAVAVGVVLSKNGSGDGDKAVSVENRTVTANETAVPSSSPDNDQRPTARSPAPGTRRPSRPLSPVTEQPTDDQTLDPTVFPTTTQPTPEGPMAAPSVPSVVDQFLIGLPAYSIDLAESDADSPQAKALAWLENDPLYNDYQNVYRLNQRYALAVLYYSTNGTSWDTSTGWMSDDNECTWYMDDEDLGDDHCGADSRLTMLDLYGNGLEGSIPTEVELLTDLEEISLAEEGISGTIPTEL
jgi:hypothetical protein